LREINTKEQLLLELMEIQKELEGKLEIQDRMIRKFQMLTEHEGLFSQIIDYFPYPLAVFSHKGTLSMANQSLMEQVNISGADVKDGKCNISILNKLVGVPLSAAVRKVFKGKTLFLNNVEHGTPLNLEGGNIEKPLKSFNKAILFSVPKDDGLITHGVVVLIG
jgi:hypothetical protein